MKEKRGLIRFADLWSTFDQRRFVMNRKKAFVVMGTCLIVFLGLPAWAADIVFYDSFESGDTAGWWAPARVGETGQKTCYGENAVVIACAGTGQDGDIQPGVAWPNPRFVENSDGTVTDMLTGLVWLKDAACNGTATWETALTAAAVLADGTCGLSDGSVAGDWRLPSVNELQSLINYEYYFPALSDGAGTGQWSEGDAFSGVQGLSYYWSSTSSADGWLVWGVLLFDGGVSYLDKPDSHYVWPVRGGAGE